jgi:hypothetical protein
MNLSKNLYNLIRIAAISIIIFFSAILVFGRRQSPLSKAAHEGDVKAVL